MLDKMLQLVRDFFGGFDGPQEFLLFSIVGGLATSLILGLASLIFVQLAPRHAVCEGDASEMTAFMRECDMRGKNTFVCSQKRNATFNCYYEYFP